MYVYSFWLRARVSVSAQTSLPPFSSLSFVVEKMRGRGRGEGDDAARQSRTGLSLLRHVR